jgi:hypothetical protein
LFIGTFDAILGAQDGLPAISPNGLSVFHRAENAKRMQDLLKDVKNGVLVLDSTNSEVIGSYKIAEEILNFSTAFFPFDIPAKDYTEYRLAGYTKENFMGNVLGIQSPFVDDKRSELIKDMLTAVSEGHEETVYNYLELLESIPLNPLIISHTLQLYIYEAQHYYPVPLYYSIFTREEWQIVLDDLSVCQEYKDLRVVLGQSARYAYRKAGGF